MEMLLFDTEEEIEVEKIKEKEIMDITYMETVSLIKGSIEIGYNSFHATPQNRINNKIQALGESFGYIFQWLNDLEPFSQAESYERHKGKKENFDYCRKNIALWTLYQELSEEEKKSYQRDDYKAIIKLYRKKEIEKIILDRIKGEIEKMGEILIVLKPQNETWVDAFKELFNAALNLKGWGSKIQGLR